MAVLVEGISVIVRARPLIEKYDGGWDAFLTDCPTDTLCADGQLVCTHFMDARDAKHFASLLTSKGLTHRADGEAVDFVIADQQEGLSAACEWAELGMAPAPGMETRRVVACRLAGSDNQKMMTPDSWSYEGSLSATFGNETTGTSTDHLEFLRHEDGADVYRDPDTGEEVVVDRSGDSPNSN
ncbi:hypothetical protein [Salinibacter altiplanensis]|uniref:hypothetical protein n=1 Tax=Salinibacter altiplanensis TaxID=1803181 RepID=UPI000C9FF527|nr:hypothetical protein [Salinibacter altiplanensis]